MNIAKEHILLAVIAAVVAVSIIILAVILKSRRRTGRPSTKKIATLAVMSAMSIVLMVLIRIPFPTAPFLEYDPADIPILISTFLFGPWWGLLMTAVVSIIQGITVSASSGIIGIIMHFAATGGFVLAAGLIYTKGKSLKRAIAALIVGALVQTALMVLMNLVFTPLFMKTDIEIVVAMLIPTIIPFNLIKAGVNAIITFIVYKFVSKSVSALFD
jgi:riboflavin transporter FmnP